jgi:hypothetical protein
LLLLGIAITEVIAVVVVASGGGSAHRIRGIALKC